MVGSHSHDASDQIDSALSPTRPGAERCSPAWWVWAALRFCRLESWCCRGRWRCSATTLHNVADALTAVPLLVAFTIARRPPNKRYTYGYGRAEDLGGLFVLAMIGLSSVLAAYESIDRLLHSGRSATCGLWPEPP